MALEYWTVVLEKDDTTGGVVAALFEGEMPTITWEVCRAVFGPFDTAADISAWITRHWAPRARLPLR